MYVNKFATFVAVRSNESEEKQGLTRYLCLIEV
jgi:hypothetical protein